MQTWRPQKTHFFENFVAENENFSYKVAFFIVATLCTSNWATILWVWASSESYSKIPKRFSVDL